MKNTKHGPKWYWLAEQEPLWLSLLAGQTIGRLFLGNPMLRRIVLTSFILIWGAACLIVPGVVRKRIGSAWVDPTPRQQWFILIGIGIVLILLAVAEFRPWEMER